METSALLLRPARLEDAPLLQYLVQAAFTEYEGKLDPPSGAHQETVETVRELLQKGGAILALVENEPAGCVFFQNEGSYLWLERLSVLPKYRRRGVARALIEAVEQEAALQKIPAVQLGTRLALTHLKDYYTRLGYRPIRFEAHEGYTKPTYVLMEKEIRSKGSNP
ncbi:MAG TPA: GNAT family N-acetyltransferase [Anaerolineaceae bacterium]|nr:GNAT family N-acetyltransferase [Anaerolineaceae bacterium]